MTAARALAACAALAGLGACVDPDYHCTIQDDCDVGEAARCEVDRRCTAYDPVCPSHRRYSDHSGPVSNSCFDDAVTPANRCAPGQPPAVRDGCGATVCKALPSCCDTGWSEACVELAQLSCSDLVCDTRIAITASDGKAAPELWSLTWDGKHWAMASDARKGVLAWLAPAPGEVEPRLAGFTSPAASTTMDELVLDGGAFPVTAASYLEASSVDFDRDGRPTAVLGYTDAGGNPRLAVVKLDDGSSRAISAFAARLSWGDLDYDAFPDGMAASTSASSGNYRLLSNAEAADRSRTIGAVVETSMGSGLTTGAPAVRGFGWVDLNRDHLLDVIAYGSEVNLHAGARVGLPDTPQVRIDCDPPAAAATCNGGGTTTNTQTAQSFAGAAVPEAVGTALVLATFPASPATEPPSLHRAEIATSPLGLARLSSYVFPSCGAAPCPPILAVVARDLDGDHQLDVIAIDSELQVYTALGSQLQLTRAIKLPTTLTLPVTEVHTSVSGAPR
ncbi:MAG TPA: hypothetical protein VHW23_30140 [Kofleriaceae bacterium]|nr:hypothetical protein [Kofleriaceae bacterium]